MKDDFTPTHSDNLVFIGAGATAALGMPSTFAQTQIFRNLSEAKNDEDIEKALLKHFNEPDRSRIIAFLNLLDNDKIYEIRLNDLENAKKIYDKEGSEEKLRNRILELRHEYDWNATKKIINLCPEKRDENTDNLILDAYSIIDKRLLSGQSLKVYSTDGKTEIILDTSRLQGARNFLVLFVNMMFASAWYKITKGEKVDTFSKYKEFINSFDRIMQKEGMLKYQQNYHTENRDFYLFSTSFVSFNFDMVFPWIFMTSHHDMNELPPYIQDHPLKLWLDYGCEHRGRKLDKNNIIIPTLEFTESVASRENEESHVGTPLHRAGKFYFAHGSANWRECPVCGRMTFYFGYSHDKWKYKSTELIPPFPFPIFQELPEIGLTEREKQWRKDLRHDSLQCMHCGSETRTIDAPMIMQTMYKSTPTSFLEEIQRNVKVALSKAKHIVLLGYSLPTDDTIWQHAFSEGIRARNSSKEKPFCSVVVGTKGEQRWLKKDDLTAYIKQHKKEDNPVEWGIPTIENAISIFGKENIRVWTAGIPQVFGDCTEDAVKQLLDRR